MKKFKTWSLLCLAALFSSMLTSCINIGDIFDDLENGEDNYDLYGSWYNFEYLSNDSYRISEYTFNSDGEFIMNLDTYSRDASRKSEWWEGTYSLSGNVYKDAKIKITCTEEELNKTQRLNYKAYINDYNGKLYLTDGQGVTREFTFGHVQYPPEYFESINSGNGGFLTGGSGSGGNGGSDNDNIMEPGQVIPLLTLNPGSNFANVDKTHLLKGQPGQGLPESFPYDVYIDVFKSFDEYYHSYTLALTLYIANPRTKEYTSFSTKEFNYPGGFVMLDFHDNRWPYEMVEFSDSGDYLWLNFILPDFGDTDIRFFGEIRVV